MKSDTNGLNIWTERRTIIAYALSIIALAEIIDLTIVSVAIPDLMGALGANINEVSLTMTSYIVAAAVCIPLTGLVTRRYGVKTVALSSTLVFGVASVLCGTATSLNQMIFYRIIQGIGGAFLPALAQMYVVDNFTKKEQPKIITIVTVCIVLGPIIGPVMGGTIIEHISWRWIFYVNVPICLLGFGLIAWLMKNTKNNKINIDYISFIFMAFGIGLLEYFIDEGHIHSWFQSINMIFIFAAAVILIGFFVWRGILGSSVIKFEIFKNLNFVLSCLILFLFFSALSGCLSFFPAMLQNGYGMPPDTAAYIQAPRGIAAIIGAPIYITLSKKIDARALMTFAMLLSGVSTMYLGYLDPAIHIRLLIILNILQGLGMIGVFVLIMSIAYIGVPSALSGDASGVFNFFRNFAASIGTSVASTMIANQQQVNWHSLAGKVSPYARGFSLWFANTRNINMEDKVALMAYAIAHASMLQAYLNVFYASGIALMIFSWLPFLLKKPDPNADVDVAMAH